jgi:uncharacterized GH25 family protein
MTTADAHEFWLEPLSFEVEQGANLQAHIKVGEGLDGDTYAFFPNNFERFDLTVNDSTGVLKNRFAQKPAVDQVSIESGLHILTYQSKPSRLRYKKREIFEKFLKAEGIEWVLQAHEERKLPPLDFTELYKRYAKSLIKVGDGRGNDRLMGLLFEWVVLDNPYMESDKKAITLQLHYEEKPFPNSTVNVFVKRGVCKVKQIKLKTDTDGKVDVPVSEGGVFLINAVHMIEPDSASTDGAEWMSLWASTTFLIE